MPTQVWVNRRFTDQYGQPGDKCIPMILPDACPTCQKKLVVDSAGDKNSSFGLEQSTCPHAQTYEECWGIRITGGSHKVASAGMPCSKCGDFNSYGEPNQPDGTFKCYGCRR